MGASVELNFVKSLFNKRLVPIEEFIAVLSSVESTKFNISELLKAFPIITVTYGSTSRLFVYLDDFQSLETFLKSLELGVKILEQQLNIYLRPNTVLNIVQQLDNPHSPLSKLSPSELIEYVMKLVIDNKWHVVESSGIKVFSYGNTCRLDILFKEDVKDIVLKIKPEVTNVEKFTGKIFINSIAVLKGMYTMYVILDKNYIDKVGAKFKRKVLMITRHSISITGAKKIVNEVQQRGSPTSYLITDGETGVVLIIKPSS